MPGLFASRAVAARNAASARPAPSNAAYDLGYSGYQHSIFGNFRNGCEIGTAFLAFGHFGATAYTNDYGHVATVFESSQGYFDDAALAAVRAEGFDFVRLPISPSNLWNASTNTPRTAECDWVFNYIGRCLSAGLRVDFDPFHGQQRSAAQIANEGGDPVRGVIVDTVSAPINYWTRSMLYAYSSYMAGMVSPFSRFNVVYEAINEPVFLANTAETYHTAMITDAEVGQVQNTILPALYSAIRAAIPNHGILLPAEWGSPEYHLVDSRWPTNLDTNVAMVAHLYHDYGAEEAFWTNMGVAIMRAQVKHRCPIFVTEYGAPRTDPTAQATFISRVRSLCDKAGTPASAWSHGKASISGNLYEIYNNAAAITAATSGTLPPGGLPPL